MIVILLPLIILAGFVQSAYGRAIQNSLFDTRHTEFLVSHYTEQDGLPHNTVNCSLNSEDGFIWFGTWYGLSRFDGYGFEIFSPSASQSSAQPPRKVEAVVEDGEGNLWIKTSDWKLSVLFKRKERFEDVYDELKPYSRNIQIIKIQSDAYGKVLLLTKDKNLLLATTTRDDSIKIVRLVDGHRYTDKYTDRLKNNVTQLSYTKLGGHRASYVGKDYQIYSIIMGRTKMGKGSQQRWQNYFVRKSAAVHTYHSPGGYVWTVSADGRALTCTNTKNGFHRQYPLPTSGKITNPQFVATPKHGYFFLAATGDILHVNPHTMECENIADRREFSDAGRRLRFFSMKLDKEGLLWLTSTDNGVYKLTFPQTQFRRITLPLAENDGVKSMLQLSNGDVWIGTRSRDVYLLDIQGKIKHVYDYATYGIGSVYYMMQDAKGVLWLSTKGDGLVKVISDFTQRGGYRFVHFRHDENDRSTISGNNVYMTYIDSQRNFWVGTLDGGLNLMREKDGKVTFYHKYNGIRYPAYGLYMEVRNMAEDANGRLWVGTIDGLMSLDTRFKRLGDLKIETYRTKEVHTIANSDVYTMYKDRYKNIWICAFGGGLCKLTGLEQDTHLPILKRFGAQEGLLNDVIVSVLEDKFGRLWLVSTNGLSCLNPKTQSVLKYDNTDGFPNVYVEGGSSIYNRNGEIWLGCKEGIIAFRPERLHDSPKRYPIYIIGGEVNNQDIRNYIDRPILDSSIVYSNRMQLTHSQSMFTLEYAALSYTNSARVTYRYRLEGFDRDWHYVGTGRIASYTNVPPGEYVFTVEAKDYSDPAFHNRRRLTITILPPWWETWWAYLIYAVLFITAMYGIIRYARYQIRLKNNIYVQTKLAEYKRNYNLEQQNKQFLDSIGAIIKGNLTNDDFEIDVIARSMGMSRSALFKKLKAVTGETPSDFVKNYKLNYAVELLKQSNVNITEVAYQSGFSDVSYFGKCFRKKFGMSPREYINSSKE